MSTLNKVSLLSNKHFIFLWLEQTLTQIAYHLVNFSLIISVFKLTNSNLSVGILLLCFYLPSAFFVNIAGLTSDFVHRKKIIITTNIIWSILVFTLSFFTHNFPAICLIAVLIQTTDEFFHNAVSASIPLIVPSTDLLTANSFFNITFYSAMILASLLVSLLSRFVHPLAPLYLASFLTLTGAFFISKIKIKQPVSPKISKTQITQIIKEILKGWQTIKSDPTIKVLTAFLVVANSLLALVYAIAPGFLSTFGIDASDFSFVLVIPLGVGFLVGNFYLNRHKTKKRKIEFIQQGLIFLGIITFILSASQKYQRFSLLTQKRTNFETKLNISLPLSLLFAAVGFSAFLTFIPATTSFQENLPEETRGRTTSINQFLTYIISAILTFSSGAITDLFGFYPLFLCLSLIMITAGLFSRKWLIKAGILAK